MDIGIRFSSPVLDDVDVELLEDTFARTVDNVLEILECVPYEISIITCLLKRLEYKIKIINEEEKWIWIIQ